jgi:hypothetical protein
MIHYHAAKLYLYKTYNSLLHVRLSSSQVTEGKNGNLRHYRSSPIIIQYITIQYDTNCTDIYQAVDTPPSTTCGTRIGLLRE